MGRGTLPNLAQITPEGCTQRVGAVCSVDLLNISSETVQERLKKTCEPVSWSEQSRTTWRMNQPTTSRSSTKRRTRSKQEHPKLLPFKRHKLLLPLVEKSAKKFHQIYFFDVFPKKKKKKKKKKS